MRVWKLLSLSGMVGRMSINAHIAPRTVKMASTSGSPAKETEELIEISHPFGRSYVFLEERYSSAGGWCSFRTDPGLIVSTDYLRHRAHFDLMSCRRIHYRRHLVCREDLEACDGRSTVSESAARHSDRWLMTTCR